MMMDFTVTVLSSEANRKMANLFFTTVFLFLLSPSKASSVTYSSDSNGTATDSLLIDTASNETTTMPTMKDNDDGGNTGAVIAGVVVCIVVIVALVIAVLLFRKKQQSRSMDNEKKMQIQMTSARNAGVYQDLTVSVPTEEKPAPSPEHERLKPAEDV